LLIADLLEWRRWPVGREECLDHVGEQDRHLAAVEVDVPERHAHKINHPLGGTFTFMGSIEHIYA
jgi:hypothetical protein